MINPVDRGNFWKSFAILGIVVFAVSGVSAETDSLLDTFAYANEGVALAEAEDYEGAVASYNKAIELYPDIAETHYNRAVALEHLGMREQAISDYKIAIELDPNLIEARANLFLLTVNVVNPITIAVIILCGCILGLGHHSSKKKEEMKKRVMQGIKQE